MLQPGTCTVNANQAGNASFLAAPTMSQAFSISGNVPGAPTIGTAVNGIGQATISFTAPASTGGFPITSYTVSCGAFSASGPASPLTVTGLSNNTNSYLCSASATNTLGTGPSSGTVMATPSAVATLALVGVQSRKLHAGVPFDQPIDWTIPITGAVSVEPRQIGVAGFNLIFQFNGPVTAVGGATSLDAAMAAVGTVSAPSIMPSGTEVSVTLTGVANGKRSTVTINGVNGAGVFTASMAFLIADVTGDRTVDVFDVIAVKAQGGKPIGQLNFTRDINADGTIDVFDLIAVKGKAGTSAP